MDLSRRDFIISTTLASLAARAAQASGVTSQATAQVTGRGFGTGKPPMLVSSANGWNGIDLGYRMLREGKDTLDAAIRVGKVQEDDPTDTSVGLGGLPNEEGVVELDSSCMHGPTRRAGAVGGVRNIQNVALLAQAVMQHTGHVMLVGEGAERFGYAMGFPKTNLLTDDSRKTWMLWKEFHTNQDWWGPGLDDPAWKPTDDHGVPEAALQDEILRRLNELAASLGIAQEQRSAAIAAVLHPPHGTIHCSALNEKGEISGMTTTSGLAWKVPGRCGDTPIIGAGCYTDQDVGSCGATGSGEENIRVAGAHSIIENMRKGMSPQEAGLEVLKRIARNFNNDQNKIAYVSMKYYILRKDGAYAGVTLWSEDGAPARICVHDGQRRMEPLVALYQGKPLAYPPRTPQPQPNAPKAR